MSNQTNPQNPSETTYPTNLHNKAANSDKEETRNETAMNQSQALCMKHQAAAKAMGVGRNTWTRIVEEHEGTDDPVPFIWLTPNRRVYPIRLLQVWVERRATRASRRDEDAEKHRRAVLDAIDRR